MTDRRTFLGAFLLGILTTLSSAAGQQPGRIPRIGFLFSVSPEAVRRRVEAFRQGLLDLGYVERKNIIIEQRWAEGKLQRLPALAAELVRLEVDVMVASDGVALRALKAATTTIPIVMTQSTDPVEVGFVASLARPGGNITGMSFMSPEMTAKGLELLLEAFPRISRVAVLVAAGDLTPESMLRKLKTVAQVSGAKLQVLTVADASAIASTFSKMAREHVDALVVRPHPIFLQNRARIVKLAAQNRLPSVYPYSEFVDAGGLMSYATNYPELWRRSAAYVDKILKGAKPAELPIEQPTKFELVVNLKTAKALGLTIPQSILARADEVIE